MYVIQQWDTQKERSSFSKQTDIRIKTIAIDARKIKKKKKSNKFYIHSNAIIHDKDGQHYTLTRYYISSHNQTIVARC